MSEDTCYCEMTGLMPAQSSTIQVTNILTIIEDIAVLNPFFSLEGNLKGPSWGVEVASDKNSSGEVLATDTLGMYVMFKVNSSVAFAVYGETDTYQGTFVVETYPPLPQINLPLPHYASASATYNMSSPWVMNKEIKYLATGLDKTKSYMVNITNAELGKMFNIGKVILFSTIPLCILCFYAKGRGCSLLHIAKVLRMQHQLCSVLVPRMHHTFLKRTRLLTFI